jgi:hypothetical protein
LTIRVPRRSGNGCFRDDGRPPIALFPYDDPILIRTEIDIMNA